MERRKISKDIPASEIWNTQSSIVPSGIRNAQSGIFYMLLAAFGFSVMGAAAKMLGGAFNSGQLVFFRNLVGLVIILISLYRRPPQQEGGRLGWLIFRGMMGTMALYTLLFCILHMPLGTAMTYNLTSTIFIALFSFLLFREYHGPAVLFAVLLGFAGMLLIYKPAMDLPWGWHFAGLVSGISSAIAYLTVGRLSRYYDARMIVLSFLLTGVLLPILSMSLHYLLGIPEDGLFIISFRLPVGTEWAIILLLGLSALFGQYFVTRAYGAGKAGIVSVFSYANIVFSVLFGLLLGDAFPDAWSISGMLLIILSGGMIALLKRSKT
jgi:drug/metabolite transporter (DMT)-like permease